MGAVETDGREDETGEGTGIETFVSVEVGLEVRVSGRIEAEPGLAIGAVDWERRASAAIFVGLREACGEGVVRGLYGPNSEG